MKYVTRKIGRSAVTGRFRTVRSARKRWRTSTVETIKIPVRRSKESTI